MSDETEIAVSIGKLTEAVDRIDGRVKDIDIRLANVETVTTFGRGVAWALIRFGVICAGAVIAWEWIVKNLAKSLGVK